MKNLLSNMSLSNKFFALYSFMLLVVLVVSGVTVLGSLELRTVVGETTKISAFARDVESLSIHMGETHAAVTDFMLSGDIEARDRFNELVQEVDKKEEVLHASMQDVHLEPWLREKISNLRHYYDLWLAKIARPQMELAKNPYTFDQARLLEISHENHQLWSNLDKDFIEVNESLGNEVVEHNQEQYDHLSVMLTSSIAGAIFLLIVCIGALVFSRVLVIRPLVYITYEFEKLAQYDLSGKMEITSKDEIGAIATGFNHVVNRLREIVGSVRQASSQMAAASEEMSSNMQHMAQMGENQTVASTQISEAVRDSAQTAQEIDRLANSTKANVDAISVSADEAQGCMKDLQKNSEQIADVLTVIRGIAEQVNLLALNAAIEAARAGDAGRGFAVVADEVRKLAGHTTNSTAEIEEAIRSLHDNVKATGESLFKITGAIKNISSEVVQVTGSVSQQSAAMEEISSTVDGFLGQVTHMDRSIKEMEEVSGTIASEATTLDGQVEVFKL